MSWKGDSEAGLKGWHRDSGWSVWFLSQHWYRMCSTPHPLFIIFQAGLHPNCQLFYPTEADTCLFYHLNTACIQIGLFAVYFNTGIPKTLIVLWCCCSLPCTLMEVFPIPQNLRNLFSLSSWGGGAAREICWSCSGKACMCLVGSFVSFCQACSTFPLNMLQRDGEVQTGKKQLQCLIGNRVLFRLDPLLRDECSLLI